MARELPPCVDTVIIGNGPSALILSYILHGHVPYYIGGHHDTILDAKLSARPKLLDLTPDLYAHFLSSLRYSTQSLPVNTLLDTLLRPNADTEINPQSCVEWRYEPSTAVPHVVIGQTDQPGGQWAENPISASAEIATLSYAEQLSLPGYSYAEHLARTTGRTDHDFLRPSRAELAEYLAAYPSAVGISDSIYNGIKADGIRRTPTGFTISSLNLHFKHLVLASGIFTLSLPPPALLSPLTTLSNPISPLLVIGSGFSAADIIISTPPNRKIIHLFKWAPETRPSPLKGCHHSAYPEYAGIYKQMKLAALPKAKAKKQGRAARSPLLRRKSNPFFTQRDWGAVYEGLPNAEVVSVERKEGDDMASVRIRLPSGEEITRVVGGLAYVVGRRGTLGYVDAELRREILGPETDGEEHVISGSTLRAKAEVSLEVARNVFVIGSLAGDSLIRHAVGGCVYVAGRIEGCIPSIWGCEEKTGMSVPPASPMHDCQPSIQNSPRTGSPTTPSLQPEVARLANGHADLHLDRRKRWTEVEVASARERVWGDSGWWGGGGTSGGLVAGWEVRE
ncbi:hypothetical protein M011DRAFT_475600 [Sporormia fimetaria CBS 119925]|uniref:FAD/NAD(P)-binding domain-containing protein n=1 Tax=Sporormia fimetaria CBS 119925 TaxID=1340428 RepID=A0A6A6VFY5_9PLEO|nr:hypothetical protein M011DRAFT_475600 [Sporormia fimetaria CBS 119925]